MTSVNVSTEVVLSSNKYRIIIDLAKKATDGAWSNVKCSVYPFVDYTYQRWIAATPGHGSGGQGSGVGVGGFGFRKTKLPVAIYQILTIHKDKCIFSSSVSQSFWECKLKYILK